MARPTLNPSGGLSPEELAAATSPELEGSALTASPADVTGGMLEAQAAVARDSLAAPLEQAKAADDRSFSEAFQAVLDDSPTAWVAKLAAEQFQDPAALIRFDGADLMPGEVGSGAFWREATAWIAEGKDTKAVLDAIESSWP